MMPGCRGISLPARNDLSASDRWPSGGPHNPGLLARLRSGVNLSPGSIWKTPAIDNLRLDLEHIRSTPWKDHALLTVIQIDFRTRWEYPVMVARRSGNSVAINGPGQALNYLRNDFVFQSGRSYLSAVWACQSVLRCRGDAETARQHFIAAYADYMIKLHP